MLEEYNMTQTTLKIIALYRNNYKKSLHLREIARETKVDVKAVQLQLQKLESMNVLSSNVRGRNKEYTLNQSNIITKYFLSMAEAFTAITYTQKNFTLKKIINQLDPKISDPIILFGSFAKNTQTTESDIDLLIITDKKIDRKTINTISSLVNRDINIKSATEEQFLNGLRQKDPLIGEVIVDHIVLKGADKICDILWQYYADQ
jgi:predicted nucleotidyltransferase